MLMQAIGPSEQGTKEYVPVGLELKYDDSVKLNSFDKRQDEYIQGLILAHKEQVLVKELLADQTERYAQGAAIKTITDGNKVAIMGIVFNKQAQDHNSLLLTTKKFIEANIVHSSKLYSTSVNIDVANLNDLPKPDSEGFIPDWIERETLDLIGKAEADDDSILSLSNSLLDDHKMQELQHLLQKDKQLAQYIDGLGLSFNSVTANSVKELIKQLRRLVYLDLSDNDLANNNLLDLEKIIEDIQVPILKIADIGMNDVQMGKIFQSFAKNDRIENLDIEHLEDDNNLVMSQDTAKKIAEYLRSTRTLNYLSLAGNKIDWGAHPINTETLKLLIYDFLSQSQKIRSLDLALMEIDDDIGEKIAEALEKNVSLIHLDLEGNDSINSKTVKGLASVLRTHQYLKYLNLANNKLSIEHLKLILEAIKGNQVLSHINLSGNDFSGIIIDQEPDRQNFNNQDINFERLLQGNTELEYLNLANCKLNTKSLLSLFKAIENNIGLEILDIRDNKIESSIVDNILGSLEQNANQGLDIGLKVLHISKWDLNNSAVSKLTAKGLGILVSIEGDVSASPSLEERL